MSLKRYSTRRDKTEPEILRALAAVGADYIRLDAIDVLVLFRGQLYLLECKSARGKKRPKMRETTRNQDVLVQRGWPLHFVSNPMEALRAIGAVNELHTNANAQLLCCAQGSAPVNAREQD